MKQIFFSGIFQNYLVFMATKKDIKYLAALLALNLENLLECQKEIMRI